MSRTKKSIPQVETRRMLLSDLLPADYNPRKISDKAMKGLRASLERFGELGGVVYNQQTGHLVGGHQRVKALAALGVVDVEVRVVNMPLAEEKAANLTLNNPGIGGDWDDELLRAVLQDVQRELPTAFDELQLGDLVLPDIALENGDMPDLPAAAPEASKMSFALTAEQREIVDAAIEAAGSDGSTAGRAFALTEVCRGFCS
jgi:ParB-like chromosome segregation protein Spo0J